MIFMALGELFDRLNSTIGVESSYFQKKKLDRRGILNYHNIVMKHCNAS